MKKETVPAAAAAPDDSSGTTGRYVIEINGTTKVAVEGGRSVFHTLADNGIFLPTACGGKGVCGLCKIKVTEGAGPLTSAEISRLSEIDRSQGLHLACQVQAESDLKIQIPDELLGIRQYRCKCTGIKYLTYDTKLFRFSLEEPASMTFVPGQYIQFLCPQYTEHGHEVYRTFSIASNPDEKNIIELIVRRVPDGICTAYCFEYLKEGDTVRMSGPYGQFRLWDSDMPMIFIAGGSGMAPFVSILHQMKNTGSKRRVDYFFGGNQVRDIFLLEQMKEFESSIENFHFIPVAASPDAGEGWSGQTGLVTDAVKRAFNDLKGYQGYLCGSPGMIEAAIKVLLALGMTEDKIYYDKFA